jgi:hypothetical protein
MYYPRLGDLLLCTLEIKNTASSPADLACLLQELKQYGVERIVDVLGDGVYFNGIHMEGKTSTVNQVSHLFFSSPTPCLTYCQETAYSEQYLIKSQDQNTSIPNIAIKPLNTFEKMLTTLRHLSRKMTL